MWHADAPPGGAPVHPPVAQSNVIEGKFDLEFFKSFDLVVNGLDNVDARRHVNRLCLAAGVPLVESGTAGYLGQVSVHIKGEVGARWDRQWRNSAGPQDSMDAGPQQQRWGLGPLSLLPPTLWEGMHGSPASASGDAAGTAWHGVAAMAAAHVPYCNVSRSMLDPWPHHCHTHLHPPLPLSSCLPHRPSATSAQASRPPRASQYAPFATRRTSPSTAW